LLEEKRELNLGRKSRMPRPMRSVQFLELLSVAHIHHIHHETQPQTVKIMHSDKRDIILHRPQEPKTMIEDIETYRLQVRIFI